MMIYYWLVSQSCLLEASQVWVVCEHFCVILVEVRSIWWYIPLVGLLPFHLCAAGWAINHCCQIEDILIAHIMGPMNLVVSHNYARGHLRRSSLYRCNTHGYYHIYSVYLIITLLVVLIEVTHVGMERISVLMHVVPSIGHIMGLTLLFVPLSSHSWSCSLISLV